MPNKYAEKKGWPVPLKEATAPKALNAAEKNALELRALQDERERWHWLLTIASEQGKNASCLVQLQNHVNACERAIEALRRKMQTVSLSESSQNGVVSRDDSHAHGLGTRPKNTMKIGREC